EDERGARELFVLLLERIKGINQQWAGRVVARTPRLRGAIGEAVREDLMQELALTLWQQLAHSVSESWELFFFRALAYAQQHTAAAYMEQRGYWARSGVLPLGVCYRPCCPVWRDSPLREQMGRKRRCSPTQPTTSRQRSSPTCGR